MLVTRGTCHYPGNKFQDNTSKYRLTLFNGNFEKGHNNWASVDILFSCQFSSAPKQRDELEDLSALSIWGFKTEPRQAN